MNTLFDISPLGSSATFSPCGAYRYTLARRWSEALPVVNFLMLNPSTATTEDDDPTIRRCINFAKSWGQGGIVVTNLFAWRATKPDQLRAIADPIGLENDAHIGREARAANLIVRAWGSHVLARERGRSVAAALHAVGVPTYHIRLNGLGHPSHPLYLPGNLEPKRDK